MSKKILVVDDDNMALMFVELFIISAGFNGETVLKRCDTAKDAIEAIEEENPDILFLDYQFKSGTGRDVAQWIDKNWKYPILVATHSNRPETEAREKFFGTSCVKHFTSWGEKEIIVNFVKQYCL